MSISEQKLENILRKAFPSAKIELVDTVGDQNHYRLVIKDDSFAGISIVNQHKLVGEALKDILDSGELHAISIKTLPKCFSYSSERTMD